MFRVLAAHKASRLVFAVLTLSIAISGVVASYTLSHAAIRAFQTQLALKDDDQFLLSARLTDMEAATGGRLDGPAFAARIDHVFATLLPAGVEAHVLRFRGSTRLSEAGPRPVRLVEARRAFLVAVGADPLPGPGWDDSRGLCVVGSALAQSLPVDDADSIMLDGRGCRIAGQIDITDMPPFFGLNDAVFLANGINDVATDLAVTWTVYLKAPAGRLSEAALRGYLGAVFDLDYLEIWSGAAVVARAERLIAIVRLIANGLGLVILLVGGASIASLMSFSVAERAREIAVKRTIGASKHQILREIVTEAMLIGLMSVVIGALAGAYLSAYLQAPLSEFLAIGLAGHAQPAPWPIIKAVIQFLAICAIAGAVPGWRAARRDPATILRAP
jgi:putative ABC transport system permease protein